VSESTPALPVSASASRPGPLKRGVAVLLAVESVVALLVAQVVLAGAP